MKAFIRFGVYLSPCNVIFLKKRVRDNFPPVHFVRPPPPLSLQLGTKEFVKKHVSDKR